MGTPNNQTQTGYHKQLQTTPINHQRPHTTQMDTQNGYPTTPNNPIQSQPSTNGYPKWLQISTTNNHKHAQISTNNRKNIPKQHHTSPYNPNQLQTGTLINHKQVPKQPQTMISIQLQIMHAEATSKHSLASQTVFFLSQLVQYVHMQCSNALD